MAATREEIYSALWSLIKNNLIEQKGFKTCSRRLKHWNDVPDTAQPALFMLQRTESCQFEAPGDLVYWIFKLDLYLYCWTAPEKEPGPILNPLLDAIHANFRAGQNADGSVRLANGQYPDGMVLDAFIDGTIETSEGCLGDQEVAIIPVTVKLYF